MAVHKPSAGSDGHPVVCVLCSIPIIDSNKAEECPKSADYMRPIPRSIFGGDLGWIGDSAREIRDRERPKDTIASWPVVICHCAACQRARGQL